MIAVIKNTPSCLIPKELFKEELIKNYGSILHKSSHYEYFGKDDWGNFYLIYPKPNEEDSLHEMSMMYGQFREKYPNIEHAVGMDIDDNAIRILVFKNQEIAYSGSFSYDLNEDVLYHITNITQQFFDTNTPVDFYYQQISPQILRLLSNYYELKPF